jgi:hypothetical protein
MKQAFEIKTPDFNFSPIVQTNPWPKKNRTPVIHADSQIASNDSIRIRWTKIGQQPNLCARP